MKKHVYLFTCIIIVCVCNSYGQHFTYDYLKNIVSIRPVFDTLSVADKKEGMLPIDRKMEDNLREISNAIMQKNLSKVALMKLKEKAGFRIHFCATDTGRVFYMIFLMKQEVLDLITDEQLFGIYNDFKAIQLDFDKNELEEKYRVYGNFKFGQYSMPAYKE